MIGQKKKKKGKLEHQFRKSNKWKTYLERENKEKGREDIIKKNNWKPVLRKEGIHFHIERSTFQNMKRNSESHTSRDLKTKNSKSHSKDQKSEQL